jgi:hypothetical protein
MLGNSDRLRVLSLALGVSEDDLVDGLVEIGNTQSNARENVTGWWHHDQQPKRGKSVSSLKLFLQGEATRQGRELNVEDLWSRPLTALQFIRQCGVDMAAALPAISEACRRGILDLIESIPFVEDLLTSRSALRGAHRPLGPGCYAIYRVHSSERSNCREILNIEHQHGLLFDQAAYWQYVEGGGSRAINLTLFKAHACSHGVGAYDANPGSGRDGAKSLLHLIVFDAPFRTVFFTGLIADLIDNGTSVSAQRILVRKLGDKPIPQEKHGDIPPDRDQDWAVIRTYLTNWNIVEEPHVRGDEFFLFASHGQMTGHLSHVSTDLRSNAAPSDGKSTG